MIDVNKFKAARKASGLSQKDLASRVGLKQQAIGEIEVGRVATTKAIFRIADALNVRAWDLDDSIPSPADDLESAMYEVRELDPEDQAFIIRNLQDFIRIARKRKRPSN